MDYTEVEQERYNYIKETSIRLYPIIEKDKVIGELSEHLFNYYAKKGVLPDIIEENDKKLPTNYQYEYHTPTDIEKTLIKDEE